LGIVKRGVFGGISGGSGDMDRSVVIIYNEGVLFVDNVSAGMAGLLVEPSALLGMVVAQRLGIGDRGSAGLLVHFVVGHRALLHPSLVVLFRLAHPSFKSILVLAPLHEILRSLGGAQT
jgi:hypothetical protein